MKKITSITIKEVINNDPDISYLGEITKTKQYNVHRKQSSIPTDPDNIDDSDWYMPFNHLPHDPNEWKHVSQEEKERVIKEYGSLRKADIAYAYADMERLQNYYEGKWWCIGIVLTARFAVSDDGIHFAYDDMNASLWGIESDINKEQKNQFIDELKHELKQQLLDFGFTEDAIATAMASIKEEK
jgi:hypothetical protein